MRTLLRQFAAAAVTSIAIAACSDVDSTESTGPNGDPKLFVVLSVNADTISEGATTTISARVTDQTGFLKSVPVTWKSSDPSVASVSGGTITGVRPGSALVTASAGTGADSAQIVVTARAEVLDVQPSAAIVALGDTIRFTASTRDGNGNVVEVDQAKWSSSDTIAARFVNGGSLIATAEGELRVSAEAAYKRGSGSVRVFKGPVASVTISPSTAVVYKGERIELDVTLRDQQGRLTDDAIVFGSSDYSKATVDQSGVVSGVAPGSVVITATSGRKTGSATVTVLGTPAASVSLVLPSDTVPVGVEVQATAIPLDAEGNVVTGRTIAYQSANPSVATVTSTGTVKGIADGSTNISAIVDGKVDSKRISVGSRRATSIVITPGAPSVSVGQKSQLSARLLDQAGIEMTGQPIGWTSGNQNVAIVSSSGEVTAMNAGTASISASSGDLSASVVVSVVSAPVASVEVSPTTATVVMGGSPMTLTANAFDANGNLLTGRVASWSSQNPTIASVSSGGLLSAVGVGSTTVTASIEGKSATVMVTVGSMPAAPVSSVTVRLVNATLNAGEQTEAVAELKDAQGNTLSRPVTWSSLDTAVAKVSSSGRVTAYAGGTVAIMAHSENVSGAASLTVKTPAPSTVATVSFEVPTRVLVVGQSVQSTVTLKDAQGNTLTGRTITYSTENSTIATVSAGGMITAVGSGNTRISATSGGISVGETFTVTDPTLPQTVATISVTPSSAALSVGQTSQETAVARDAQGNAISITSFTWTTSNPAVAQVSGTGMVSAVGAGAATIRAVTSGVTGSMAVSVTAAGPTPPPPPPPSGTIPTILALVGQTKTVTETAVLGPAFAEYDRLFDKYFPIINDPANPNRLSNYYDRSKAYYARYARTGDPKFLALGHELALSYRQDYLEVNNYGVQPHWSQVLGLEVHYRLTGDTLSRRAVGGLYAYSLNSFAVPRSGNPLAAIENTQSEYMENRIQARVLQGALSAYRMGASFKRHDGPTFLASEWPTRLRDMLNKILSTQNANGSFSWIQICGGQLNYMVGMLNDVLIEYYRDFEPDPRIPGAIERANEYLWTTQWIPTSKAFKYASVYCSPNQFGTSVGGPTAAGDLNGLFIASFGWLYNRTGDPKWKIRGDDVMAGLVLPVWAGSYGSSKQFNQAFAESYRYLGWR